MAGFVDIGQNRDAGRHQVVRLVIDFVIFDEIERLGLRDSVDMRHFVTVNDTIKLNFLFNFLKEKSLCKKNKKMPKKFLDQIQVFFNEKIITNLITSIQKFGPESRGNKLRFFFHFIHHLRHLRKLFTCNFRNKIWYFRSEGYSRLVYGRGRELDRFRRISKKELGHIFE